MNELPKLHSKDQDRLRFEVLLAELSARFVGVTSKSIDQEIVNAQHQIVLVLDLERSTLVQTDASGDFVVTHSWQLPGLEPFPKLAVNALAVDVERYSARGRGLFRAD